MRRARTLMTMDFRGRTWPFINILYMRARIEQSEISLLKSNIGKGNIFHANEPRVSLLILGNKLFQLLIETGCFKETWLSWNDSTYYMIQYIMHDPSLFITGPVKQNISTTFFIIMSSLSHCNLVLSNYMWQQILAQSNTRWMFCLCGRVWPLANGG